MFTGIIEEIGKIQKIERRPRSVAIFIGAAKIFVDLKLGDSISVDGVCLTVKDIKNNTFSADLSDETLSRTTLRKIKLGEKVNLERSTKMSDRLGGHFVTGHIDTIGRIISKKPQGDSVLLNIEAEKKFLDYLVPKGSVGVDGISLTLIDVLNRDFTISIIPFTLKNTTIGLKKIGGKVNLEADIIGKYVKKYISGLGTEAKIRDFLE